MSSCRLILVRNDCAGDEWFGDPVTPLNVLKERMAAYREEIGKAGRRFEDLENPLFKEAFVGDTTDQAWEDDLVL